MKDMRKIHIFKRLTHVYLCDIFRVDICVLLLDVRCVII